MCKLNVSLHRTRTQVHYMRNVPLCVCMVDARQAWAQTFCCFFLLVFTKHITHMSTYCQCTLCTNTRSSYYDRSPYKCTHVYRYILDLTIESGIYTQTHSHTHCVLYRCVHIAHTPPVRFFTHERCVFTFSPSPFHVHRNSWPTLCQSERVPSVLLGKFTSWSCRA